MTAEFGGGLDLMNLKTSIQHIFPSMPSIWLRLSPHQLEMITEYRAETLGMQGLEREGKDKEEEKKQEKEMKTTI